MPKEQLTINTATLTGDQRIFATRKSAVKCQLLNVSCPRSRGFTSTPILMPFRFLKIPSAKGALSSQVSVFVKNSGETKKQHQDWCRGFTLVEMIVSLGLFTIVMFIATSSFLSIVNADRKARAVRIAADNLNIALEDMSRRIKTGTSYSCGGTDNGTTRDCTSGDDTLYFTEQDGTTRTKYWRNVATLYRDISPLTSTEITITNLKFIVIGSDSLLSGDKKQPIVVIAISGSLGVGTASSTFKIQTTVTQRQYDN